MTSRVLAEEPASLSLSAYGKARSTVQGTPLSSEEVRKRHAYWRARHYLALGMIDLQANPLLEEFLKPEMTATALASKESKTNHGLMFGDGVTSAARV